MSRTFVYTQFGGPENQAFLDLPKPVPGPGQLLVAVRAAGVNPADWKRRQGLRRTSDTLAEPAPLGLEAAGIVEEVGPGVEGFSTGDAVFGSVVAGGGFAEYAVFSTDAAAHKPPSVTFEDASTLPVAAATAYDGVQQLGLEQGQTLLVTGAGGGVGVATVQIAVARGITVVGIAGAAKKELVESLGAKHVTSGDGVAERVRDLGYGTVDAIYDLVGGEALRSVAGLVRDPSKIITAADVPTATALGGSAVARARNSAVLQACAELVAAGTLKPLVTTVLPLEKAADALALVEEGHATGKVVIVVG